MSNQMTFDVLSSRHGDCHPPAGIAGLLIALQNLPSGQKVFSWSVNGSALHVEWSGDLVESWDYLIRQTFQLEDGIIKIPGVNNPVFTHYGFLNTLLQSPKTRPQEGQAVLKLPSSYGLIEYQTIRLASFIHQSFAKKLVKGRHEKPVEAIDVVSWLIPNCSGGIETAIEVAIPALFSPLTWGFYQIQEQIGESQKTRFTTALVCPIISNLERYEFVKPLTPEDFVAGSLADALLHFAGLNQIAAHGFQYYSEKANRVAKIIAADTCEPLPAYAQIRENFPNYGGLNPGDRPFIAANPIRGLAAKNLLRKRSWYEGMDQKSFNELRQNKQGLLSQIGVKPQLTRSKSDHRKGYNAGYNAFNRGRRSLPDELPNSEWGNGYRQGFEAAQGAIQSKIEERAD